MDYDVLYIGQMQRTGASEYAEQRFDKSCVTGRLLLSSLDLLEH